ncbi:MAG: M60 family metallopeptidase, partial [Clostridia bacterium]|nr:M60 family metallopeptidase [Clostridia bacterium]
MLLVFILILSVSIGAVAANKDKLPGGSAYTVKDDSLIKGATYDYEYRTTAAAGYTAEILGTVDRNIPKTTSNEGIVTNPNMYPTYGYTPRGITEQDRRELINEAWQLCSTNTRIGSDGYPKGTYNKMDKDGNLTLVGGTHTVGPNKLYKHTCAVGMYYGNVSDDEKAVIKKMTFNPRSFQSHSMYNVTGLYAPAGEVVKIEISEEDMEATGGLTIHIGQALYNNKANNIWLAKGQMQRFPVILNTMVINKSTAEYDANKHIYTGYVGSFLGGPVYVGCKTKTFSVTISGAVTYSHFILGHTTPEEFEANKDSTAPYFDLEVWDNGVLHSGPKSGAQNFSYDDLFKAAVLWDQVTSVTTNGNNQNIVFLYDPFVAAGAAVAFPGQYSVNCPAGWMSNSLNYESIIKNGAWGNFHEYHHNFQGYGVGNGGEVTNNALTLVSYALFTKISANRRIESLGASGLGGWNSYTSATWALDQVKAISDPTRNPSNGNQGLALYATLLHNFGADAFIQVRKLGGGQSYLNYFKKWEQVTHNNMTYYFKEMLKADEFGNMTDEWLETNSNPDYPMFVPVSCVYQTGRSYNYDDENLYFQTMQPYVIPYGQEFTIDLSKYTMENNMYKSGSIVIPEGFSYKILK